MKKYRVEISFLISMLLSAIASLAVHCSFEVIESSSKNPMAAFFAKFGRSFTFTGFADILVFAAVFMAVRYVFAKTMRIDGGTAAFAAFLSCLYVLVQSYFRYNTAAFIIGNGYQVFISLICFAGFFILFYCLLSIMLILLDSRSDLLFIKEGRKMTDSHCWLLGFAIIFICQLPWLLMNYPGSTIPDAVTQIAQFYGDYKFSAHHPPLSTYIFGAFLKLGTFVWDINFGFFLYVLFQTVVGALIYSYGISRLHKGGVRLRYCMLGILFFALTPLWGSYAQSLEKDVLYTHIATFFLIWLIDVVTRREYTRRDAVVFVVLGVLSSLLRKNGLYAVIPSLLVLIIFLKKEERKRAWISIVSILIIYSAVTKFIYPVVLDIEDGSIREALSIPFQQTACYVVNYGDDVTEREREVIDVFLEYDKLAESYDPTISDPVKALYKGNIHLTLERAKGLAVYFAVWFRMFWKHPDAYISAAMNMAYGYIAPVGTRIGATITPHYEQELPYLAEIGLKWKESGRAAGVFVQIINSVTGIPLAHYAAMPGLYTWIASVAGFIMTKKKKMGEGRAVIFIPILINVLVCIASPLGNSMRYALPVAAAAPFMVGWALYFSYSDSRGAKGL